MAIDHRLRDDKKVVVTLYCDVACCQRRKIIVSYPWELRIDETDWKTAVFRNEENEVLKLVHVCPRHSSQTEQ